MGEEVTRLVTEIDTSQVGASSRKMEGEYRAAVAGMDQATKGAQRGVEGIGQRMQNVSRIGAVAGRSLSAAIGASTAAAAASQRSWVGLGTSILASFAAGGPVAGGIAIVAAGIGLLASRTDDAAERLKKMGSEARTAGFSYLKTWEEAGAAAEAAGRTQVEAAQDAAEAARLRARVVAEAAAQDLSSLDGVVAALKVYRLAIVDLEERGTFSAKAQARALDEEAGKLRALVPLAEALSRALGMLNRPMLPHITPTMEQNFRAERERAVAEARSALLSAAQPVRAGLSAGSKVADTAAARALSVEGLARAREGLRLEELKGESMRRAEALQRAFNGERSEEIQLSQEIVRLEHERMVLEQTGEASAKREAADLAKIIEGKQELLDVTRRINTATADRNLARELQMMGAITDEQRRQLEIVQKVEDLRKGGASTALIDQFVSLKAREPLLAFARDVKQTLSQSFSDAIVDGIFNGFANGGDLFRSLAQNLVSQTISSVSSQLFDGLLAGLFGGGGGGGGGSLVSKVAGPILGAIGGGGGAAPFIPSTPACPG